MRTLLGLLLLTVSATLVRADSAAELIKKLSSTDNESRRAAAKDLAGLGKEAKPAIAALTKALKDGDRYVQQFSAEALGNIGPDAKGSIAGLTELLKHDSQPVREAAIKAIGKMGAEAIPAMTKVLSTASSDVQEHAIAALASAGESGVPTLASAIKDTKMNATLRRKAVEAVVKMGKPGRGALAALTDTVKDAKIRGQDGRQLRLDAIAALGQLATSEDSTAVKALDTIAKDEKIKDNQLKNATRMAMKRIESRK